MKYRDLGKTGLKVSEIGYGTWQLTDDPDWWFVKVTPKKVYYFDSKIFGETRMEVPKDKL